MPRYLLKKKYVEFAIYLIVLLFIVLLINNYFYFQNIAKYSFNDPWSHLSTMMHTYPMAGMVVAIKLWQHWHKNQIVKEQLKKEKAEAELNLLKAQIHPHFLFNTINNIYALSLEASKKTPESLLKLSELLNYVLYECNHNMVSLEKEINLIRNYLSLEKLRHEERLDVILNINGSLQDLYIAPLILLPFVENSFKHGVNSIIGKAWVSIDISIEEGILTFKTENNKSDFISDEKSVKILNHNGGIGLKNVKKRLELMYHNSYELKTIESDESYLVILELNLNH
ncbi:histidine kinase [uncultured Algibacter sp.]|uniref:sensor histidine kinase n=1 Tax=uncultured Algibacter sp. TaxID=298659 RepID=UPI00263025AF|nr:histidine kinase [uncultured Algibacter sp.]